MPQNDQTNFKSLAANAERFLVFLTILGRYTFLKELKLELKRAKISTKKDY